MQNPFFELTLAADEIQTYESKASGTHRRNTAIRADIPSGNFSPQPFGVSGPLLHPCIAESTTRHSRPAV